MIEHFWRGAVEARRPKRFQDAVIIEPVVVHAREDLELGIALFDARQALEEPIRIELRHRSDRQTGERERLRQPAADVHRREYVLPTRIEPPDELTEPAVRDHVLRLGGPPDVE